MAGTLLSTSNNSTNPAHEDRDTEETGDPTLDNDRGVKLSRDREKQCEYSGCSEQASSSARYGVRKNTVFCNFCPPERPALAAVIICKDCRLSLCSSCDSKVHGTNTEHGHERQTLLGDESSKIYEAGGPPTQQDKWKSFLLLKDDEKLMVSSVEQFVKRLKCDRGVLVKVVSIFGNTGDGKSHTLNHAFFGGEEIFNTSESHESCTIGVWCFFCPERQAIMIDTEGLLGSATNHNQRTRLLLKVLAISDVIIYRTRAERLHSDMFTFLGDASEAYMKHFTKELQAVAERCCLDMPLCNLGPSIVIFHETVHTKTLDMVAEEQLNSGKSGTRTAEDVLRDRFADVNRIPNAFSSIKYVGTKTVTPPTNFSRLGEVVTTLLKDTSVRSARSPDVIYQSLLSLNEKFCGDIEKAVPSTFPDHYFTCMAKCLSCNTRCECSMNHERDNIPHQADTRCQYQAQFDNRIFLCKVCFHNGKCNTVMHKTCASTDNSWFGVAKFAWSGSVLECKDCGVIYRSRQYWYGNKDPVEGAVQVDIVHVWPGSKLDPRDASNAARRVLDGVNMVAGVLGQISAKPTQAVSEFVADSIAPEYWVPNNQITHCDGCNREFEKSVKKHHCRSCGGGFCDDCSSKKKPVPERGWGTTPVRVCDSCYDSVSVEEQDIDLSGLLEELDESESSEESWQNDGLIKINSNEGIPSVPPPQSVTARSVGETVQSAVGKVSTVLHYPKDLVTDAARPVYWVPDSELVQCFICQEEFGKTRRKHHCRACGQGVCYSCSKHRLPVPSQGWDHDVRVCDNCALSPEKL